MHAKWLAPHDMQQIAAAEAQVQQNKQHKDRVASNTSRPLQGPLHLLHKVGRTGRDA
jgi:hypothetical protein